MNLPPSSRYNPARPPCPYDPAPPLPSVPPRRVPDVGAVLHLTPAQWRYGGVTPEPLTLEVRRVRADISWWYSGDWVWVEGWALDAQGARAWRRQVLVAVDAIPEPASADASTPGPSA